MKKHLAIIFLTISLLLTSCRPATAASEQGTPAATSNDTSLSVPQDAPQVLPAFTSIEIDVLAADIRVIAGDEWTISYALSEKEPVKRLGVEGDTLYVETSFDPKEWFDRNEDWFVIVTVPESADLFEVKLESISGNVEIRSVSCENAALTSTSGTVDALGATAQELNLKSVSGALSASDVSADHLEAETVSSDLSLKGTFGQLEIHTVSGGTDISGSISLQGAIESVSGHITFSIDHPAAIQANSVGSVTLNGERASGPVHTTGEIPIDLHSVSGEIHIQAPV